VRQLENAKVKLLQAGGTPFTKKDSPRAPRKSARRIPSARTTQSLTWGPGPTSHVAGTRISAYGKGEPPRKERTAVRAASGPPWEDIFNPGGGSGTPHAHETW
jgi:hypothetical protein